MKTWIVLLAIPAVLFGGSANKDARKSFDRAVRAAKAGRIPEAAAGYRKAVELDPSFAEAWCALGRLQAQQKEYGPARQSFAAAVKADPGFTDPYLPLAMLQHDARDWTGLLATTDGLLRIEPYSPPLVFLFQATAHYNLHDLAAAEKSAREGVRIDGKREFPRLHFLLSQIALTRGDRGTGAEELRAFLDLAPNDADAARARATLSRLDAEAKAAAVEAPEATFHVRTKLTLLRFRVIPARGGFLSDLRPEDIEIREDGEAQQVAFFEGGRFYPRKMPMEISLLFDTSGSVQFGGALDVDVFDSHLLREYENVSIGIYGFSDNLIRFTTPTRDSRKLQQALVGVRNMVPRNTTLFGSIAAAAQDAGSAARGAVRILIVFSDGLSNAEGDEDLVESARQTARKSGVAIYPVLLSVPSGGAVSPALRADAVGPGRVATPLASVTPHSWSDYVSLATETGGRAFQEFASADVLPRILGAIATDIRYEYVAGYYPSTSDTGAKHKVTVKLRDGSRGELIGGARVTVH